MWLRLYVSRVCPTRLPLVNPAAVVLQMRHPRFPCHVRLPRMGREAWMYSRSRQTSSRHRRQHSPHQRRLPLSRTIVRLHRISRAIVGRTLAPLSCSRCQGWTRSGQTIWLRVEIKGGEWIEEDSMRYLEEQGCSAKASERGLVCVVRSVRKAVKSRSVGWRC